MTSREAFLALYHHEKAEFIPADGPYDMLFSPAEHYRESKEKGAQGEDWFGVHWTYTEPGLATPTPGVYRLEELSEWKEENVIPSNEMIEAFDWEKHCEGFTVHWDRENRISVCTVAAGFFERMHHLLGFENALVSFYTEPEAVHEFLDALLEFKKKTIKKLWEYARPDVLCFMDDYGSAQNLFFSVDMWEEFFSPRLKKLIEFVHDLGMIFEMHSCGYITPLVGKMVDLGIDALQPLQAVNDLKSIKENYGDKIMLHGGITASDMTTDDVIREKAKECIEILAPGGGFVPMFSECMGKEALVKQIFIEECEKKGITCR